MLGRVVDRGLAVGDLQQAVVLEDWAGHIAEADAVAIAVRALEFRSGQQAQLAEFRQVHLVVGCQAVVPVQDVVGVPVGVAQFTRDENARRVVDVLPDVHVVESTGTLDEELVGGGEDDARVVDRSVLGGDPRLAFAHGDRILRPTPFVLIEVVIPGQRLNGAIGVEEGVGAVDGVIGQGVGHRVTETTGPGGIDAVVDAPAQAGRQHDLQPVGRGIIAVETTAHALVTVADEIAAVVVITDTGVQAVLVAAAAGTEAVVVLDAHADGLIDPVGVGHHGLLEGGLAGFRAVAGGGESGEPDVAGAPIVLPRLLTQGQVLLRVEHVGQGGGGGQAHGRAELVARAGLAALGGDENDPVGTARAVDAGRRRILQDFHRLNVVGVDRGERVVVHGPAVAAQEVVLRDRNAVHHVERIASGRNGSHATDANQAARSGDTGALRDLHTGRLALKGGFEARGADGRDLLAVDLGDGAGDFLLALDAIAHHNHVVHQHRVRLELDVNGLGLTGREGDRAGGLQVADEGVQDLVITCAERQGVAAVHVGGDAACAAVGEDGGARQGRAVFIADDPRHRLCGGGDGPAEGQDGPKKQEDSVHDRCEGCRLNLAETKIMGAVSSRHLL